MPEQRLNAGAAFPYAALLMGSDSFAGSWLPEDAALTAARDRAAEVGLAAVTPLVGATLSLLATLAGARAAVEVGTGAGLSSLWLVRGMAAGGVLTSLDAEGEHHRLARALFADADVPASRVRLIAGRGEDVMPRLSEAAYDLVHLDIGVSASLDLLPQALRVLRPGGVLIVARAFAGGRISEAGARDPEAVAARALARTVRDDLGLNALMLPLPEDAGLLIAVRAGEVGAPAPDPAPARLT